MAKTTAPPARTATAHQHKSTFAAPGRLTLKTAVMRNKKRQCIAIARSGERCKSAPLPGQKKCLFHTPGKASECGQRGGRRRAIFNPANLEAFTPPQTAEAMLKLVAHTVVECRAARLDAKTANAIFAGAAAFRSLLEVADLEARVQGLEGKRGTQPRPRLQ